MRTSVDVAAYFRRGKWSSPTTEETTVMIYSPEIASTLHHERQRDLEATARRYRLARSVRRRAGSTNRARAA
jgi:hypothetical protein